MICKKCGHDVDKYEVILIPIRTIPASESIRYDPYCPCGEKIT